MSPEPSALLPVPLAAVHIRWQLAPRRAVVAMVASGLVAGPWRGIEAVFPGMVVSVVMVGTGSVRGKPV